MKLSRGTRLGPYEIEAALGAGGMGEVYRARDTRLNRTVAIKVIIDREGASAVMRERFDREAHAIAQLSHPNICTLHDVGHHEGTAFLVMEHLDGETLAARLARQKPRSSGGSLKAAATPSPDGPPTPSNVDTGPRTPRSSLPLDETVRIATQLADALTAAHRAGIVHRDLKPGNIMLTRTGVKVLDFGLAKLKPSSSGGVNAPNTTTDLPLTSEGVLVGTIPYMAPEQLEGRTVDSRTDIFAFGAIVYEMATGHRAFAGESQASVIAAILDREPEPISVAQPLTPRGLERLIRKCLAKDPDTRWQTASDIADELRWLSTGGGSDAIALPASVRKRSVKGWAIGAGAVLLAAAATVAAWRWSARPTPQPRHDAKYTQATFAGDVLLAALSPDGRTVAYASSAEGGGARMFVRDLTGGQPLEIWKGAYPYDLGWLPNGSQLMVSAPPGVWLMSRLGGAPRQVETRDILIVVSPDGTQLAHAAPNSLGFELSAFDGTRSRKIRLQGFRWLSSIDWNALTNRIALSSTDDKGRAIVWSVTPEGNDLRQLYSDDQPIRGMCSSPSAGAVYLFRTRHGVQELVKVPLTGAQEPSATVLASGLRTVSFGDCSISADGERLLYVGETAHANIWRLDISATSTATALTRGTSRLSRPSVSPDGQWIVASLEDGVTSRIVKLPAAGGGVLDLAAGGAAVWSPDGKRLAFVTGPFTAQRIWVSDAEGRAPQEVKGAETQSNLVTWIPDGRLAWQTRDARNYRIRDLASGQEELLVKNPQVGFTFEPTFSPRGDQVALFWGRKVGPERTEGLWVLSWPSREERFLVPKLLPIGWSENGEWIYALEEWTSAIVRVSARTARIEPVGKLPQGALVEGSCSVTPDWRAIVCAPVESVTDAWIIDHFDPDAHGLRR